MTEEAIFINAENEILLKKAIAKSLYSKKLDQPKISKILNLSQPMVSNYCSSNDNIPRNIMGFAERISEKITKGNPLKFHTCVSFVDKPLEGQFFIARKNEVMSDENNNIVDNLTEAFFLLKGRDISGLLPEVKVNLAMAKNKAESSEDVASFLNGLIIADDKVIGFNGIRFGKSKHLSSLLLYLKAIIDVNAIMNLAYIKDIGKTGFNYSYLTKGFKFVDNKTKVDVLLHKGDFGLEPCAYVLGKDAVEVVNKVMRLKEEFDGIKR